MAIVADANSSCSCLCERRESSEDTGVGYWYDAATGTTLVGRGGRLAMDIEPLKSPLLPLGLCTCDLPAEWAASLDGRDDTGGTYGYMGLAMGGCTGVPGVSACAYGYP
jgi:hypothetical protein